MPSSCLAAPGAGHHSDRETPIGHTIEDAVVGAGFDTLAQYLNRVVDHRSRRGLRYELGFLLAVVVAATACAGHDEVAAQAQWAADDAQPVVPRPAH